MLDARAVFAALRRHGVTFFTGVPDSLLKDLCACIAECAADGEHVIAANEGAAVAMAAGHHLGSGNLGVVYFQNSGLGNAVNPLLSLADPAVYALPMLLLIGWRGEPSTHDEPQHVKQGRVMLAMLEAMEIPYRVLSDDADEDVRWAAELARTDSQPVALVVRKNTFAPYASETHVDDDAAMSRERAIELIVNALAPDDAIVSTTGMLSRELFETRARRGEPLRDFLTVGSMGHASAIAAALAQVRPERQVFCLDGDGAFLMHMGSAAIHAQMRSANFKHVLLNNGAHDSVGGQPTVALACDLTGVARACGYTTLDAVTDPAMVEEAIRVLRATPGPALLEIRVRRGARAGLGRPTSSPRENKQAFVRFLGHD